MVKDKQERHLRLLVSVYSRVSAADESLTTTGEVTPKGNDREQPVADFANCFVNTEKTPIEYCGKITLQPEELLLYCLVKISSPGSNINLAKGYTPQKIFRYYTSSLQRIWYPF